MELMKEIFSRQFHKRRLIALYLYKVGDSVAAINWWSGHIENK